MAIFGSLSSSLWIIFGTIIGISLIVGLIKEKSAWKALAYPFKGFWWIIKSAWDPTHENGSDKNKDKDKDDRDGVTGIFDGIWKRNSKIKKDIEDLGTDEDEIKERIRVEADNINNALATLRDPSKSFDTKVAAVKDTLTAEKNLFDLDTRTFSQHLERLKTDRDTTNLSVNKMRDVLKIDGRDLDSSMRKMVELSSSTSSGPLAREINKLETDHKKLCQEILAYEQHLESFNEKITRSEEKREELTISAESLHNILKEIVDNNPKENDISKMIEKLQSMQTNRREALDIGESVKNANKDRNDLLGLLMRSETKAMEINQKISDAIARLESLRHTGGST